MNLRQFKDHIQSASSGKMFDYGISKPFSWRGSYDEVAFTILEQPMSREQILDSIDDAYRGSFYGYKGGQYNYDGNTPVHFEGRNSEYTGGGYCAEMIAKVEGGKIYTSQEMRLVDLAFKF